jgi:hypothetical protein
MEVGGSLFFSGGFGKRARRFDHAEEGPRQAVVGVKLDDLL